MQNVKSSGAKKRRDASSSRTFKVGLVGAQDAAYKRIARIFNNTEFRVRRYEAVQISPNQLKQRNDVDFVIMCSLNPTVVAAWRKIISESTTSNKPRSMIYLTKALNPANGPYQLAIPINPAKLIKLLDHFTIKELKFFPEFEIGNDSAEMDGLAASGIRFIRSNNREGGGLCPSLRPRALVVDDSLAVRRQMQIEFEMQDADLDVAETAEKAMQAIEKDKYDIIFLDVVMPGMDGYAACKQIKRSLLNKRTPVVMLTSKSGSFDKIKGTLAGCDSYLVKPLNHNDFESVFNKYVKTPVVPSPNNQTSTAGKANITNRGDKVHASK